MWPRNSHIHFLFQSMSHLLGALTFFQMKLGVNLPWKAITTLYCLINNVWFSSSTCHFRLFFFLAGACIVLHQENVHKYACLEKHIHTHTHVSLHSVFQLSYLEADSLCNPLVAMTKEILLSTFHLWIKYARCELWHCFMCICVHAMVLNFNAFFILLWKL